MVCQQKKNSFHRRIVRKHLMTSDNVIPRDVGRIPKIMNNEKFFLLKTHKFENNCINNLRENDHQNNNFFNSNAYLPLEERRRISARSPRNKDPPHFVAASGSQLSVPRTPWALEVEGPSENPGSECSAGVATL